ncbi:MAG: zf-HC2 domain-containing protein [Ignavibacteria bacterium]|nr:zf-HC2 domain-containing protein [Ignavibacteria bacterium]
MEHYKCDEIKPLVDDYLEGMISAEGRAKMEEHLKACSSCKKYLEDTVLLVEKASLLAQDSYIDDKLISKEKKAELWSSIEANINTALPDKDSHIYNMSGLEDEYIPLTKPEESSVVKLENTATGRWGSFIYYMSGMAAVLILAFVIYGVNQFLKKDSSLNFTDSVVEISGGPKWMVTSVKGSPLLNNLVMKAIDSLSVGSYITTDDSSKAELYVAGLGSVIIEPNSRVKLVKSVAGEHRIQLDYGSIDADIKAAPRTFFVDAGTVTAVDLGCSYKFSIDKSGDGLLYVREGKVSLESAGGRESLVPEGKFCVTKQGFGPGTPFREDSAPELKKALMEFDFGNCGGQCVNIILKNAKKTDAVTLVNILPRVDQEYKQRVYAKVSGYYPAPKNIPADSIPHLKKMENVNEWVDEIMEEVQRNVQENMQRVEESMKQLEWQKNWQEHWQKNWDKSIKKNWNYNYGSDSNHFNWETPQTLPTPEEMEELNRDMMELQKDLNFDNEEFRKEMERVKEELKRVNEEIKREMDQVKEETKREMESEKESREFQKKLQKEQKEKMNKLKEKNKEKNKNNDTGDDDDFEYEYNEDK